MRKSETTKNEMAKQNRITYGMILLTYITVMVLDRAGMLSSLMKGLLVPICIYVMLAVSLNLVVGILGELSLGHAGFMCIGAFSGAFFSVCTKGSMPDGLRFFVALVIGSAMAGMAGVFIGIPVLRLKGDYLAIVTLAFGEIVKNLVNVLYVKRDGKVIINGPQGITGTPGDASFTVGVILVLASLFLVLNLTNSRDGRAIMAIRDNEIAAQSIGIPVTKYKLLAFTISASIAGAAGVLYAHNLSTLTALPKNFGYNMSIMILVFVVLGGIGNMRGSVIAAVVLTLLPELLRGLSDFRMLIYAVVLIAMMLFHWSPGAIELREKYSLKRLFGKGEV